MLYESSVCVISGTDPAARITHASHQVHGEGRPKPGGDTNARDAGEWPAIAAFLLLDTVERYSRVAAKDGAANDLLLQEAIKVDGRIEVHRAKRK
jgi:hypothetical protein